MSVQGGFVERIIGRSNWEPDRNQAKQIMSRTNSLTPGPELADAERRPLLSRSSTAYEDEVSSVKQDGTTLSRLRGIALSLSMFTLIFLLTCNVSLMTTMQSPIARALHASNEVTWFNSAYFIAVTSLTPISGKLCQIFTPRVYLLASIIILAVGLAITSQAQSIPVFLAGRAICGIGGAAVTPVAFILVTKLTPPKRRGLFFGLINTGYTTGLACGAIIASALKTLFGWRMVFWAQIPVAVIAVAVVYMTIPREQQQKEIVEDRVLAKLARVDFFGAFILLMALVLMLYSLSAPKVDLRAVALSIGGFVLFVFVEAKWAAEPIVPPTIMRSRANMLSGIATVGVMTARWGVLFYTPVFGIAVRGFTLIQAGALLIPTNVGFATGGLLAGYFHIRRTGSFYMPTLTSFAAFAIVQFGLSEVVNIESPLWLFCLSLFLNGFAAGALLNYSLAHLLHLTPTSEHIIVIPFNATFRSFSGSFGSAICGGYFLRTLSSNLYEGFKSNGMPHKGELIRQLVGIPQLVQDLVGDEKRIAIEAYESALRSTFFGGVGLAIVMLVIQAGVGWTSPEDDAAGPDEIRRIVSREAAAT